MWSRFWVHKAAAHASLEKLCGLWETPDGVPHYVTTKPPRYDELRLKARNACLKLYESIHELNDKWMDFDVDLFFLLRSLLPSGHTLTIMLSELLLKTAALT